MLRNSRLTSAQCGDPFQISCHHECPPVTANQTVYVRLGATIRCRIHGGVVSSVQVSAILWFTAMIAQLQSTCSSRTELGNTALRFVIEFPTANSTGAGIHRYSSRKWASSLTSSRSRFVMRDADIRTSCRFVMSPVDFTVFCTMDLLVLYLSSWLCGRHLRGETVQAHRSSTLNTHVKEHLDKYCLMQCQLAMPNFRRPAKFQLRQKLAASQPVCFILQTQVFEASKEEACITARTNEMS